MLSSQSTGHRKTPSPPGSGVIATSLVALLSLKMGEIEIAIGAAVLAGVCAVFLTRVPHRQNQVAMKGVVRHLDAAR
jgi:hypothetical protein